MSSNCKISQIIFCAQIIMMLSCNQLPELEIFKNLLTKGQLQIFKKIQRTRLLVYLYGGMFGAILAKLLTQEFCSQALLIMVIQTIFYFNYPWVELMVDYLDTPQQKQAWKNLNNRVGRIYTYSLLAGGLSSILSVYLF
uniref:Uncharacterized protein n=1 Tax=viral metagenome TaxID=1070528 RepID=A0A6C0F935_9ZZZZ